MKTEEILDSVLELLNINRDKLYLLNGYIGDITFSDDGDCRKIYNNSKYVGFISNHKESLWIYHGIGSHPEYTDLRDYIIDNIIDNNGLLKVWLEII